jgi:hypothetical protein
VQTSDAEAVNVKMFLPPAVVWVQPVPLQLQEIVE